jgi:hypothetical protein
MTKTSKPAREGPLPPVYIVSGGVGSSGEILVHTALAQFAGRRVPVVLVPRVRETAQVERAIEQAAREGATVVHTLVDPRLRQALEQAGRARGVATVDLMGPLLTCLTQALGQAPVGQPGLYHQLRETYLKRVAAINFAMDHDDGLRPEDLPEAEVVLLGVSRVGKTPLAMYLGVLGWRAANVPVVPGCELPAELARVERRRIVGLMIDPEELAGHRQSRQRQLRHTLPADYTSSEAIRRELAHAAVLFRERGFGVIDVTHKPIETTAEEIAARLSAEGAER